MTYTGLKSSPRGKLVYAMEIVGIGVFTTYDYTPTDAWFSSAGYTSSRVYPWMKFEGLGPIKDSIEFTEFKLRVPELGFVIVDKDERMSALMKGIGANTTTRITASMTSTVTSASVESTNGFASSGNLYIGDEAISYTGKTATSFTGMTRGALGTAAKAYAVDLSSVPPVQPYITDGPNRIDGRRAYMHAAEYDPESDTVSATEIIYRGKIDTKIKVTQGEYRFTATHISDVFRKKVGQRMPTTKIPKYQYIYQDSISYPNTNVIRMNVFSGGVQISTGTAEISGGRYEGPDELMDEIDASMNSTGLSVLPTIYYSGEKYVMSVNDTTRKLAIEVVKYSPLWCLGFESGVYEFEPGSGNTTIAEAQEEPVFFLLDARPGRSEIGLRVEDSSIIVDGAYAQIPGGFPLETTSTSDSVVFLKPSTSRQYQTWSVIDEDDDMELKYVFRTNGNVKSGFKRYLFLDSGQSEPEKWCATGFLDSDFDFTEFDDAFASVPYALKRWDYYVKKAESVEKIIGPLFAMLGITPRITTDGKIGFIRIETPTTNAAQTVEVDESIWAVIDSGRTLSRINESPLLNLIKVEYGQDPTRKEGKEGQPGINIYWDDGFNMLRETRSVGYKPLGIQTYSAVALAQTIRLQTLGTHFGIFARNSLTVDIPCTWASRQLRCGDIVKVTHELIADTVNGVRGVSARLGTIIGRQHQLSANNVDVLTIRFGVDANNAGIAPSARGTSYVTSTATMTFSSAASGEYSVTGESDLDGFKASDNVILYARDSLSTAPIRTTITSIATSSVTFSSDPYGGGGLPSGGAYMTIADWDYATSTQKNYAYVADNAARPTLGTSADEAKVWSI